MLFFVDNIFRFTQAGSEVSALLGRIPSAVGYQPTLATDMGALQERITTTKKGSITSVQAIYVPADDLTDPAPATSFAHLDATTVLSRQSPNSACPAGRPARIRPRACSDPRVVGDERTASPATCSASCRPTSSSARTSSRSSAWTNSSEEDRLTVAHAAESSASCRSPSTSRDLHALARCVVNLEDTIKGFKGIVAGEYDEDAQILVLHGRHDQAGGRRGPQDGGRGVTALTRSPSRSTPLPQAGEGRKTQPLARLREREEPSAAVGG